MAQQPNTQGIADNPLEAIAKLALQCEILLREYDQNISELEVSLREAKDKRAEVAAVHDQTRTALAGVQSLRDRAEQLGLLTPAPSGTSHLRVVPDTPAAPVPEPPADTSSPRVFLIRGAKTKQILTLLASKPDKLWTSSDVAALLGLAKNDRESRSRLRGTIRNLADRGLLERVTDDEEKTTYYRPLLNWKFEQTS